MMLPPFQLVQLSEIPVPFWKGLPVFHPNQQMGINCQWLSDEYNPPEGEPLYDVGVVLEWWQDELFEDVTRVRFVGDNGSALYYASDNLWVPKDLVDSILGTRDANKDQREHKEDSF